ncbi:hypothetical protein HMPREF9420_2053 [Segatella salivae DSM 15606]|uniref:Uncharacterized protein n=1 Tax=Segatella salivae DSM 15606 TaxID=888832 RepID=E6MRD5_9BACT|nr:hypothetical protein HMPREF9420_2053 [Segatella salivae DSM 15606]
MICDRFYFESIDSLHVKINKLIESVAIIAIKMQNDLRQTSM